MLYSSVSCLCVAGKFGKDRELLRFFFVVSLDIPSFFYNIERLTLAYPNLRGPN
jgi:hypothetical protein